MLTRLKNYPVLLIVLFCSFAFSPAIASHLVGDELTYALIDSSGSIYHYRVTLSVFEDCLAGEPEAIAQDNPAYLAVYLWSGSWSLIHADSVVYSSLVSLPVLSSGPCGAGISPLCVLKKTFVKDYYLHTSFSGYTIVYQRCCKNGALTNVIDPGDKSVTYSCKIPPPTLTTHNNSAVFTYYPPLQIALNYPLIFDHSATDADGDSLSYELCSAYVGTTASNIKPWPPLAPPYDPETYTGSLSYSAPMNCSVPLSIDPVTGILTGTPNIIGRYLITVCCNEWRGGVLINTSKREFEFDVVSMSGSSYQPFAGNDTTIMVGEIVNFHASGAASYLWAPGAYLTDPAISDPVGHFPDPGVFTYILHGISDSGCTGNDTINVNVLAYSMMVVPKGFTPNSDGLNDRLVPIPVKQSVLKSFKVYNTHFKLMYSSTTSEGWDGRYRGVKQDVGNYYWEVIYEDNAGRTRNETGIVTLLR